MKDKRSFGTVRKLPSGRYQARYTAPNGGRIAAPRTFAAKIHAQTWLGDRLREIDAGAWIPDAVAERRRKRSTFGAYAQQWLETRTVAGRPPEGSNQSVVRRLPEARVAAGVRDDRAGRDQGRRRAEVVRQHAA